MNGAKVRNSAQTERPDSVGHACGSLPGRLHDHSSLRTTRKSSNSRYGLKPALRYIESGP